MAPAAILRFSFDVSWLLKVRLFSRDDDNDDDDDVVFIVEAAAAGSPSRPCWCHMCVFSVEQTLQQI